MGALWAKLVAVGETDDQISVSHGNDKKQQHKLEEDLKKKDEALSRSHKKNEDLLQEIEKRDAELMSTSTEVAELREQVRQQQQAYREMQSRVERAEQLHTKHAMVDTAFYQDDSARPPLLQAAADAVKDATTICASDLFTYTKQHSLHVNLAYFGSSVDQMMAAPRGKRVPKMALQAFLCNLLFHDFEVPDSFLPRKARPPFERPEQLKGKRLQAYHRFRDVEPADIIGGLQHQHADSMEARCREEFKLFFEFKLGCFATQLQNILLTSKDNSATKVIIMKDPTKPLYTSFLRLATAVWLLHKLAFAFEPASAEIFRVAHDSTFVEEYMESMVPPELEEDASSEHIELVGFMSVPGFTVRNSIIKSRVYLRTRS